MSTASAGPDQPRRASNHDNSFKTQQDEGTKSSHQVNLLFISLLIHGLLCFLGLHIILRELDHIAGFQCHAIHNKNQNHSID